MKQVNKETYCVAMRGRYDAHGKTKQQLEPNHIDATNALTTVQKDNLILEMKTTQDGLVKFGNVYGDFSGMSYAGNVWNKDYYSPALKTMQGGGNQPMVVDNKHDFMMNRNVPKVVSKTNTVNEAGKVNNEAHGEYAIRKLIPLECNRLMGFPDWVHKKQKEAGVSDSQEYKQAGNSIATAPLYYIFRNLHEVMPYLFDDLKVGSYFSGVGAFEMALNMLYSEINYGTPMVWFEHGGDTSDEYAGQQ